MLVLLPRILEDTCTVSDSRMRYKSGLQDNEAKLNPKRNPMVSSDKALSSTISQSELRAIIL